MWTSALHYVIAGEAAVMQRDINAEFASPLLAHQAPMHNSLTASSLATLRCLARKRRVLRAISHNSERVHELEQELLGLRQQRFTYEAYMAYSGLNL